MNELLSSPEIISNQNKFRDEQNIARSRNSEVLKSSKNDNELQQARKFYDQIRIEFVELAMLERNDIEERLIKLKKN